MSIPRRGALRLAIAGTMLSGALAAHAQQARTLTMQASWPASSTFMENFNQFADRVNKTTGGRLQIKTSAAGTIYLMMFYDRTNYTIQVEPTFASDTRRLAPNVTATPVALGRWHLIEWTVRYSTTPTSRDGATKWWLDGVLQGVYTDLQMPPDPGIIEYQFAPTWGGLGDSKAETGCYWYESAHISRR